VLSNGLRVLIVWLLLLSHSPMYLTQYLNIDFHPNGTFFLHTTPEIAESFLPLEQVIRHHFLPGLVPHPPNDVERSLFSLPAHLGGLGIFNPPEIASTTYWFSRRLAGPIVLQQLKLLSPHVFDQQHAIFL